MGDNNLTTLLISCLALFLVKAFALPAIKILVANWTRLYTSVAPEAERHELRQQIEAHLDDEIRLHSQEGYHPAEVAAHILLSAISGMPGDTAWSLSRLPSTVASKLDKGSQKVRTHSRPKLVIASIAILAVMNIGALVSATEPFWRELLIVNLGAAGGIALTRYREHNWTKRLMTLGVCLMLLIAFGLFAWTIIQLRLYDTPMFAHFLLLCALGVLPVILAIAVSTDACRAHAFGGRWWPVFVAWVVIAVISITSAIQLDLQILLVAWSTMAIGLTAFLIICAAFYGGATLAYLGATKGTARCMIWSANCIRRLNE